MHKPVSRIAVFYDGSFFHKVSSYYKYQHEAGSFLAFSGLHEFIRHRVAAREGVDVALCQIVESHFFRGRFSLSAAKAAGALESDRFLDQLLMYAGIVSHYYPMNENVNPPQEKGIDVWLAMEAYDLAVHKGFDVFVLVAGDQDFVPLVRKINGLGTRVMLIGADIEWTDRNGVSRYINTSRRLMEESAYPILLNEEIEAHAVRPDPAVEGLFRNF
jgi:hypothetical protein